jgi:hypothetical protein
MTLQLTCPHCGAPINDSPRRVGNCPACGKEREARKSQASRRNDTLEQTTTSNVPADREKDDPAEFHARALRYFQERADEFPLIQISCADDHCCAYCAAQRDKVIPTVLATPAMIPPFTECKSVSGKCRCTFIAVCNRDAALKKRA